ncbi:unnamed protein product [Adineta ricciae]|uniref:Uncharacterized protein n=1 Tax=Adineta ricciae TaxID=249248 RepID=A0A814JN43_ADIRI|nr:unnamed protein product [Adineta ricciae]
MLFAVLAVLITVQSSFCNELNQTTCRPKATQKNTSIILKDLRREMQNIGIGIYIILSGDEHGSEYTQEYDKRREWLTGFHGSSGIAIVTLQTAALWTDSRYFTQAEEELDCANWLLMRDRAAGVPTVTQWLLTMGNQTRLPIGGTPTFAPSSKWITINKALKQIGKQLQPVDDLVTRIWPNEERPKPLQNPIVEHDIKYAGETVQEKLQKTTRSMKRRGITATIISALDEVAWQFNLRGADIPYNPFFKSYAIIYTDYINRLPELFVNLAQLNGTMYPIGVKVFDYVAFWQYLNRTVADPTVKKIWIDPQVSQAIYGSIPAEKLMLPLLNSPVQRVKAQKNRVERHGMRISQIRDSVARLKHLGWIEEQLKAGIPINESSAADQLLVYQKQQSNFQFPSFKAISGSGENAALPHYSPEPKTARPITKDQVYLLDAGSQYLDGTTDITRTHHFGTPTDVERRAYTRVLQGVLDIADAIFPLGTYGRSIDYLARMHLFRDGMIYGHSTGHGVGYFLGVHEGPQSIGYSYDQYEEPLLEGVFISDEPGFYKVHDFGIRIENVMEIVRANNSVYNKEQFLRFNTITYLPYERSMIDVSLLTIKQYNTINQYHKEVAEMLEPLLKDDLAALRALHSRTKRLDPLPFINLKISRSENDAHAMTSSRFIIAFLPLLVCFYLQ